MTERTKTIKSLISGQVDMGTFGLVELELINAENEIIKKDKLILDLTDRNNDLIKENKEAWGLVQEYRGDVWSGEHQSIDNLRRDLQTALSHISTLASMLYSYDISDRRTDVVETILDFMKIAQEKIKH